MQQSILANYHTHTALCKHASGTEEEYIQMAIRNGFDILGFSDHVPFHTDKEYLSRFRMSCEELPDHVKYIKELKEKYASQIKIFLGFECEYFPAQFDWLRELVKTYDVDYLGLGNHFDPDRGEDGYFGALTDAEQFRRYETTSIAAMESGLFRFFAHPDIFLNDYPVFDKTCEHTCHAICEAAAACGMPLEYNLLGVSRRESGDAFSKGIGYTLPEFWEIAAKHHVKAIVGCDAHAPEQLDYGTEIIAIKERLRASGVDVLDVLEGLA